MSNFRTAKYDASPFVFSVDDPNAVGNAPFNSLLNAAVLPIYLAALRATAKNVADTRLAIIGDSTAAGLFGGGATTYAGAFKAAPANKLAQVLSNSLPISTSNSFGWSGITTADLAAYDPRISVTSTNWAVGAPGGLGGNNFRNDTNEVSSVSFAFDTPFDQVQIGYLSSSGGATFTVSTDLQANIATIDSNAALNPQRTAVIEVPPGSRVVTLTRGATGSCAIYDVVTHDSTQRKLEVYNWGITGATIATWTDNTANYNPFPRILTYAPHLTIIKLGINNAIAGTASATYITALETLIAQAKVSGDVILATQSPIAAASGTIANQNIIAQATRATAAKWGLPLVDTYAAYGNHIFGVTQGLFAPANDPIHPGAAGYALEGRLYSFIPGVSSKAI